MEKTNVSNDTAHLSKQQIALRLKVLNILNSNITSAHAQAIKSGTQNTSGNTSAASTSNTASAAPVSAPPQDGNTTGQTNPPSKAKSKMPYVIGAVAIAFLIAGGAWYYKHTHA